MAPVRLAAIDVFSSQPEISRSFTSGRCVSAWVSSDRTCRRQMAMAVARNDSTMTTANANLSWLRTLMVAMDFIRLLGVSRQQESMKIATGPVRLEATQDSAG